MKHILLVFIFALCLGATVLNGCSLLKKDGEEKTAATSTSVAANQPKAATSTPPSTSSTNNQAGGQATVGANQAAELPPVSAPKPQAAIQTQSTNFENIVAELIECSRKQGVLTIKVRFRTTRTDGGKGNGTYHAYYRKFYVTAGSKKYFLLKDSEDQPLVASEGAQLFKLRRTTQGATLWGKFPAPPAEVNKVNIYMGDITPFEDVPITNI